MLLSEVGPQKSFSIDYCCAICCFDYWYIWRVATYKSPIFFVVAAVLFCFVLEFDFKLPDCTLGILSKVSHWPLVYSLGNLRLWVSSQKID